MGFAQNVLNQSGSSGGKRDKNALKNKFNQWLGRDPTAQEYSNYIDKNTGRVWGGLWDNIDADLSNQANKIGRAGVHEEKMPTSKQYGEMYLGNQERALDQAPEFVEKAKTAIEQTHPEYYETRQNISDTINKNLTSDFGDIMDSYLNDWKAEMGQSGQLDSGMAGVDWAKKAAELKNQLQQQWTTTGMQFTEQVPWDITLGWPKMNDYAAQVLSGKIASNTLNEQAYEFDTTTKFDQWYKTQQLQLAQDQADQANEFDWSGLLSGLGTAAGMIGANYLLPGSGTVLGLGKSALGSTLGNAITPTQTILQGQPTFVMQNQPSYLDTMNRTSNISSYFGRLGL